ncbi:uncharacterized protein LOC142174594 [Nicotiana tabacum]|uniref:Uncharacterized protein LOC142174594 n=1 Tax=Nicotiana tabacum TaxID=4097 RepID=A0AC58TH20_TOBAC
MDATGTILPLAYAVVDSENDVSWKWFFEHFKHAYGERPNMCVVSDRNESILKVRSSTDYIHTVLNGVRRYIICLENKRCSPYYIRESLLRTYEIPVNHLPDESKCNVPQHITEEVVNPPLGGKRQSGRPQK